MMKRRLFVTTLGIGLVSTHDLVRAQPRKPASIGWVGVWYSKSAGESLFDAFRRGLRELGYVEGQNLLINTRWLEGKASPRDEAVKVTAELVRSRVDVFVVQGPAVDGVKAEAGSLPVVFVYSGDPVEAKLVHSLARPSGNLTGLTLFGVELAGKQLELLKEAVPRVSRVGVLVNPLHIGEYPEFERSQSVAQRLGLTLQHSLVRTVTDVRAALEAMARDRVQALIVFPNLLTMGQRHAIAEFATRQRIPAISGWEDLAVDGNLMTYGPDLHESWRYVATYVDKILKGAKPSDLPVEQATRLKLVINLKAARALGLTIPPALLLRADQVIESSTRSRSPEPRGRVHRREW